MIPGTSQRCKTETPAHCRTVAIGQEESWVVEGESVRQYVVRVVDTPSQVIYLPVARNLHYRTASPRFVMKKTTCVRVLYEILYEGVTIHTMDEVEVVER